MIIIRKVLDNQETPATTYGINELFNNNKIYNSFTEDGKLVKYETISIVHLTEVFDVNLLESETFKSQPDYILSYTVSIVKSLSDIANSWRQQCNITIYNPSNDIINILGINAFNEITEVELKDLEKVNNDLTGDKLSSIKVFSKQLTTYNSALIRVVHERSGINEIYVVEIATMSISSNSISVKCVKINTLIFKPINNFSTIDEHGEVLTNINVIEKLSDLVGVPVIYDGTVFALNQGDSIVENDITEIVTTEAPFFKKKKYTVDPPMQVVANFCDDNNLVFSDNDTYLILKDAGVTNDAINQVNYGWFFSQKNLNQLSYIQKNNFSNITLKTVVDKYNLFDVSYIQYDTYLTQGFNYTTSAVSFEQVPRVANYNKSAIKSKNFNDSLLGTNQGGRYKFTNIPNGLANNVNVFNVIKCYIMQVELVFGYKDEYANLGFTTNFILQKFSVDKLVATKGLISAINYFKK